MPEDQTFTHRTQRIVLTATILGSSMAFLDGTVVNLVLPTLQRTFHANVSAVQWVVEAYALTLASLLLVGGSLGDRYGRRKVYVCGTLLFAISSTACGFTVDTEWLIAGRAVQGVGAALLVPGSLALIAATFPESTRGRAIGTWSGFSAVTTAVGPVAGGWIIEHFSWRGIFFLNLPLALIVVALCSAVPETRDEATTGRLDLWGAALAAAGLSAVTYSLIEWPSGFHHTYLSVLVFGGLLSFALLGVVEQHAQAPMIPFTLFRSRNFAGRTC